MKKNPLFPTAHRYSDVFPTVNVAGTMKYMQLLPHELSQYEVQMDKTLRRYLKRLQWLLSGQSRFFTTYCESCCLYIQHDIALFT